MNAPSVAERAVDLVGGNVEESGSAPALLSSSRPSILSRFPAAMSTSPRRWSRRSPWGGRSNGRRGIRRPRWITASGRARAMIRRNAPRSRISTCSNRWFGAFKADPRDSVCPRVAQRVQGHDPFADAYQPAHQAGADEARAARYQYAFHASPFLHRTWAGHVHSKRTGFRVPPVSEVFRPCRRARRLPRRAAIGCPAQDRSTTDPAQSCSGE